MRRRVGWLQGLQRQAKVARASNAREEDLTSRRSKRPCQPGNRVAKTSAFPNRVWERGETGFRKEKNCVASRRPSYRPVSDRSVSMFTTSSFNSLPFRCFKHLGDLAKAAVAHDKTKCFQPDLAFPDVLVPIDA